MGNWKIVNCWDETSNVGYQNNNYNLSPPNFSRNTLTSNPYDLLLKTIRPAKFLLEINSCLRELCIKSELNFTGADGY